MLFTCIPLTHFELFDFREEYKKCFKKWDKNGNGKLDKAELKGALKEIGHFTDEEIDRMIAKEDKNNDGQIDYSEFSKALNI